MEASKKEIGGRKNMKVRRNWLIKVAFYGRKKGNLVRKKKETGGKEEYGL